MRVVIQVESSTSDTQQVWLRSNSELRIGRSTWADVCVAGDSTMSPMHFSVTATENTCHLCDLHSDSGVLVNGTKVSKTVLHDGDVIVAGNTRFTTRIEGPSASNDHKAFAYHVNRLPSELQVYQPVADPLPIWDIVQQLWTRYNVYLIAFFDDWGTRRPAELQRSTDTIPACDNLRWARFLPLLIDVRQLTNPREYLQATWASGNLMAVFGSLEKTELLASLRCCPATFSSIQQCHFHFENMPPQYRSEGDPDLTGMLFPNDDSCWKLLTFARQNLDWPDLGFTVPPRAMSVRDSFQDTK